MLGHVFLNLVAKMSDQFLEQQVSIKFCVKLLLERKHGAFSMILEGNDKVCNENSQHLCDPRKLAL